MFFYFFYFLQHERINYLERHFNSKHGRERVIEVVQVLVAFAILVDGVFGGERDRAAANDDHDQRVKVLQRHDVMNRFSETSNSNKTNK